MNPCKRCGGEVVQRPVSRLIGVGAALIASLGLALLWPILWIPAAILMLAGAYLLAWGTVGRGRWCRGCTPPRWSPTIR